METVIGEVVWWSDDDGWGALRSPDVPSDVFAHFSNLLMTGFHSLAAGQRVEFAVEHFPSGQDGYIYRAERVRVVD